MKNRQRVKRSLTGLCKKGSEEQDLDSLDQFYRIRKYSLKFSKRTVFLAKMVFYFTSNVVEPSAYIYVGKDKFESE